MVDDNQQSCGESGNAGGRFEARDPEGLLGLISLQARSVANRIEERFPVNLTLEIDELHVQLAKPAGWLDRVANNILGSPNEAALPVRNLRVRLRHCYVRTLCNGLSLVAATKYRSAIEVGNFSEKESASERSARSNDRSASIDFGASLGAKPKMALSAGYKVGDKLEGTSISEKSVSVSQDIYEVEAVPGGWRIGDKSYGDPLKRDGCLDGPYFTKPVEGRPYTCELLFEPNRKRGGVRFSVTTRDGIHVDQPTGGAVSPSDKAGVFSAMRNKLAAICIESARDEAQELLLLSLDCDCVRADGNASRSEA